MREREIQRERQVEREKQGLLAENSVYFIKKTLFLWAVQLSRKPHSEKNKQTNLKMWFSLVCFANDFSL